jgi:ribosomal protein S12 methylthiotransferase
VDLFVGTGDFRDLPALLSRHPETKTFVSKPTFLYDEKTPRILSTPSFTAYVKIAEGCSKACTFCTVPRIRGPYRSRRIRSVTEEAKRLAAQGVRELILIAQDTTAYGEDLRDGTTLEKLLRSLVRVDGVRWIRLLYAYPRARYFTEGLLDIMAHEKKICSYLDLPIQHIDDEILKRMGRRSRSGEIRTLLEKIRSSLPDIRLRTSLIVGFPGERERQFRSLLRFVEETRFDHLGAFTYSSEEGTPASRLPHPVPEKVKEDRLKRLMKLQEKISLENHLRMVGKTTEALVEKPNGHRNTWKGRLQTQAPEIDGAVFLKGKARPGDWVEARITRALPYDLIADIERILP